MKLTDLKHKILQTTATPAVSDQAELASQAAGETSSEATETASSQPSKTPAGAEAPKKTWKQTNYHMHTTRCHHAIGKDEEYVRSAILNGFEEIGFSDHACWQYNSDFRSMIRMRVREFAGYKKSVRKLQRKYDGQINILLGMEAEYFPQYMDWLLDFCIEQDIDYLVFGNHYIGSDEYGPYTGTLPLALCGPYFDTCIVGMKTGMYAYLAHPELILRDGKGWSDIAEKGFRRICETARELDMPLEYNCLGLQCNHEEGVEMYPHHKFWEMAAQMGCKAIIGMDAHSPEDLNKLFYNYARRYLESLGIEIVDQIHPINYKAIKEKRDAGLIEWPQKPAETIVEDTEASADAAQLVADEKTPA